MDSPLRKRSMQLVRAVVERRARRGSWVYMLGLLVWLPPMLLAAGNLSFHVRAWQLLPLLIPIAAVVVQMVYPTLLGWAVIVIPSVFTTGVMLFFVVVTAPVRIQQHELAALAVSSVAAGIYVLVCAALWFARPKLKEAAVAEGNASSLNAGSAGAPPSSVA